ncbi:MAG: hypothetical protein E4H14_06510 [Candidatus Thorarchaeota archaeon]|nr:MAG: hypothetical protein E4H14_06510 [Candidatus Thorarchaeota archaeon]
MKRRSAILISLILVILFIGVDIKNALDYPEMNNSDSEDSATSFQLPLEGNRIADQPNPRNVFSLRELAIELQTVTPLANRIDSDGDTLFDSVELVLGTNHTLNDTDHDFLTDDYEVYNGLDPSEPDTNFDGIPDNLECAVLDLDMDEDGIDNAWDFDNDGDSVNDNADLSPMALSDVENEFNFEISTDGNPLYLTWQLRPGKPGHLQLYKQYWNWPNGDREGLMRDYNGSLKDIQAIPLLNVTANYIPEQSDLVEYGISEFETYMLVPLIAVRDFGNIVAFKGKIFYPPSAPLNLILSVKLIWRIVGYSDGDLMAFQGTDNGENNHLEADSEGHLSVTTIDPEDGRFEIVDLGSSEYEDYIAIKAPNGLYVSVKEDGTIVADSVTIGEHEEITIVKPKTWMEILLLGNKVCLKDYTGRYISVNPDNSLKAYSTTTLSNAERFNLVDLGVYSTPTTLAVYDDPFMLTGFRAEENHGTDLGYVYSPYENETLAANLFLSYRYLRNSSVGFDDIPDILTTNDFNVATTSNSYSHSDLAFISMARETLPLVLGSLPSNVILPITTVVRDSSKFLDLSDLLDAGYTPENPTKIDFPLLSLKSYKSMKTGFYNTTSNNALSYEETMEQIDYLIPDDNASLAVECMILNWMFGEVLDAQTDVSEYEGLATAIAEIHAWSSLAAGSVNSLLSVIMNGDAFRIVRFVLEDTLGKSTTFAKAAVIKSKDVIIKQVQGGAKAAVKSTIIWERIGQALLVIAILAESVVSILSGIALAEEIGGNLGRDIGASFGTFRAITMTLEIVAFYLIGSMFGAVGLTGVGVILAVVWCIMDVFFGLSDKLAAWLTSLVISHARSYSTTPSLHRTDILREVSDYDNNGLTLGDRLQVFASLTSRLETRSLTCRDQSICIPYVTINAPAGSDSISGSTSPVLISSIQPYWCDEEIGWWKQQTYESSAWIVPGIAMANFPLNINLHMDYNLRWQTDYRWWCFGWWARSDSGFEVGSRSDISTEYYDVFPATIDGLQNWRILRPVDYDHDGIMNHEEGITNVWRYDTDKDGLGDGFELVKGTNPTNWDGDSDGLSDAWELYYGTNLTERDSDADGLRDYRELAGWTVTFNYLGNTSLPFSITVHSDPRVRDSDSDGIDDYMEYWSNLNPNSQDTDGNGITDETRMMPKTELRTEMDWNCTIGSTDVDIEDIAVDDYGDIYALSHRDSSLGQTQKWFVTKMNATLGSIPTDVGFEEVSQGSPWAWTDPSIAAYSPGSENHIEGIDIMSLGGICTYYDLNGTFLDTGVPSSGKSLSFDVSSSSEKAYAACESESWWISEFESFDEEWTSTNIWYVSDFSPLMDGEENRPTALAYDAKHGLVYVTCLTQVLCFDPLGLADPFIFGTDHVAACAVDVDQDGYVYVLDAGAENRSITVYDYNGEKFPYWCNNGTCKLQPLNPLTIEPRDLAISNNGTIYVGQMSGPLSEVKRYDQIQTAISSLLQPDEDCDQDGLLNSVEVVGWEITITDATGTHVFNVTSDPRLNDTDNDELSDYLEFTLGSNPRELDSDNDGLSDFEEWWMSTQPAEPLPPLPQMLFFTTSSYRAATILGSGPNITNWDSDGDLLGDGTEVSYGSSPVLIDTDAEGLSDLEEFLMGSDANSSDTDQDGMDDSEELLFNSSLFLPDSDGDLMFDYIEEEMGTDPWDSDSDSDSISDGYELYFGTNPNNADTDGDGAGDALELTMWLDPLCNDTDSDGILDMKELELGTNPWNNDTDSDGILDGVDMDSFCTDLLEVIYTCDAGVYNLSLDFASSLAEFTDLNYVSIEDFIENQDSPYIVLLGRPNASGNTVEQLIYEILNDTGEVLDRMMVPGAHAIAVRYGVWTPTQTVVIMTEAYELDVYSAIAAMRGHEVTILPDFVRLDYSTPSTSSIEYQAYYSIDEIDTLKQTDSIIQLAGLVSSSFSIEVHRYNPTTTPHILSESNGLVAGEQATGKYLDIEITGGLTVSEVIIQLYYRHEDIDLNGDETLGQLGDLNETTLCLYWYDPTLETWSKLSTDMDWVLAIGLNTTDVEIYGESYAGYIWAHVTHVSLFAVAGELIGIQTTFPDMILLFMLVGCVGIIGTVIIYWSKKKTLHKRVGGKMLPHSTK